MTTQPSCKSWRDVLPVHPAANLFPLMSQDDLRELGEDIKAHRLTSPIVLWHDKGEDGYSRYWLLDGRNRLDAMEMAGLPLPPLSVDSDASWDSRVRIESATMFSLATGKATAGVDPYDYVLSANIHRRHLTGEQKRELVAAVVKAQPGKSNRQIAAEVKVDDKTVGAVRRELEATAEIPQLNKTTGKDGKARTTTPARKPAVRHSSRKAAKAPSPDDDRMTVAKLLLDGPMTVRKLASKLRGGVAPAYVAELLEGLADKPLHSYAARLVEGVGNDATWELWKVEDAEVLPAEPKAEAADDEDSEEFGKIVAAMLVLGAPRMSAASFACHLNGIDHHLGDATVTAALTAHKWLGELLEAAG